MKALTAFTLLFIILSSQGGTGSIVGGTDKFQRGNSILFRRDSTYVNVLYNKTICHDGDDFHAKVTQCVEWKVDSDDRKCVRREKNVIFQPMEDYRFRCSHYEDDDCVEWEKVPLNQSPKRILEIKDNDGQVRSTKKKIIPRC